jgi:hypothetical protein
MRSARTRNYVGRMISTVSRNLPIRKSKINFLDRRMARIFDTKSLSGNAPKSRTDSRFGVPSNGIDGICWQGQRDTSITGTWIGRQWVRLANEVMQPRSYLDRSKPSRNLPIRKSKINF